MHRVFLSVGWVTSGKVVATNTDHRLYRERCSGARLQALEITVTQDIHIFEWLMDWVGSQAIL